MTDTGTAAASPEAPLTGVGGPPPADPAPPAPEAAAEEAEAAEGYPEPQVIGHGVVQDNVTQEGVQATTQVNIGTGQTLGEPSTHGPDDTEPQLQVGEDRVEDEQKDEADSADEG